MEDNEQAPSSEQVDRFNLSRKIFVGNISYRVTQKRLTEVFSKFGSVEYCYLVKDHILKRPKGIAFITFSCRDEAEKALQATEDQLTCDGRVMRVSCAEESTRVKHMEGTLWDSPTEQNLVKNVQDLHINHNIEEFQDNHSCSGHPDECHINKLSDDILILIMSMLPWKQRISIERVCKRWQILAKQAWHRENSIHFQSVFKRFDGLTDTKLLTVLVRGGPYLKNLDISSSPRLLTDMSMDVIAGHCPNLVSVNLSGMAVTDISLRTLATKCSELKSVCLQRCFHITEKGLRWLFENCEKIENVDLQGNPSVTGNCFQKIGPNCKRLNLTDCSKLSDTGVMKICRHCKQLEELAISNCQQLTDKSLDAISQNLVNLKIVSIEKTIANVTVCGLSKIAKLSKLRHVYFSQNACVNDDFVSALATNCPFLETLDISAGGYEIVTGLGIQTLGFCSNLTTLDISYLYRVDDECIQVLARRCRLKSLTARSCSNLTDDAFEDLACLNHNLQLLDVSGCLNVTIKTVMNFMESPSIHGDKKLTLIIGATSVVEEDIDVEHPNLILSFHNLSLDFLRADIGIILPDNASPSDDEIDYVEKTDSLEKTDRSMPGMVMAAGAENQYEMEEWEMDDTEFVLNGGYDDDFLIGDDPLEMERFELS